MAPGKKEKTEQADITDVDIDLSYRHLLETRSNNYPEEEKFDTRT